jgi:alpha-glucosidase
MIDRHFYWSSYTHHLGIKIILDFVPNHSSDQHEWFKKSEAREPGFEDFYIWHDGKPNPDGGQPIVPNNWVSVFYGPAWTWSEKRQQYYFHQFTRQQVIRNVILLNECALIINTN